MSDTQHGKTFILDTNVILHDSTCLRNFAEHDIVIPITVIEELDQFKKGGNTLSYHAREFMRALDAISGDSLFNGGVRIGPDKGNVSIKLEQPLHADLQHCFPAVEKPDHRILNIAYCLSQQNTSQHYILVSKDVNLRMKAKALGITAEDYETGRVKDISQLYTGVDMIEHIDPNLISQLHAGHEGLDPAELNPNFAPIANQYFIVRNGRQSCLAVYMQDRLFKIDPRSAYGIKPRNAEQRFALHALCNRDVPLVSLSGKAGTGKTLLALAAALEQRTMYRQIMVARPIVPLSNKDIGYLPGDIKSKISPYMQPLWDNISVIQNQFPEKSESNELISSMIDDKKIVIEPLAYIRGRSIIKTFIIVDEAQNLTPHEVKTIITRAGEDTKIVFTGDIYQIDHPYLDAQSNGLSHLIEKMRGKHLYAHINLEKGERSALAMLASNLL